MGDVEEEEPRSKGKSIMCCVGSPQINFITNPISVRIKNERKIENVTLFEPFTVEYEITNLTERVITAMSTLDMG